MAKFCPNCGTSCEDNAVFCAGCGNKLAAPAAPQQPVYQAPQQPVYQAPQQPVYQAPQYQAPAAPAAAPAGNLADTVKKNIKIIIAVIAAVGLLVGIMNLVGYDVEVSASYGGQSFSDDVALSEMRENPEGGETYVLSTWVMALAGFAAGGLGAYSLVLLNKNAPGSKKFFSYAALAGTALSVVALVMGLLGGKIEMYGVEATISIHFTYWIAVIVNVAALYIDKGVLKNDYAPLQ